MSIGQAKIMGIINLNEDSFYAPSRAASTDAFRRRADALLDAGADILDLGPMSSRPGATLIDADEEWSRLEPIVETVARHYPDVTFSIDTFRASVVVMAYQVMGRFWINDISSGEWDEAMLPVAGRLGLRYVAMHHQGDFATMHQSYQYDDVVASVKQYFRDFSVRAKRRVSPTGSSTPVSAFRKATKTTRPSSTGLTNSSRSAGRCSSVCPANVSSGRPAA